MSYDPNSSDAMFSRVMERLDGHGETLNQILLEVKKTNGRVASLERSRDLSRARTALLSALVSGVVALVAWLFSVAYGRHG